MGFRNFSVFNQALLAKQGWRIITSPNSLCSRVLRARYFKDDDFMNANCPKAASFTWKSILHGRSLLKEGLIWRIGDGAKIDVWKENWIPRSGLKRPLGHKPETTINKLNEVILPDGQGWNVAKLNELFFEGDVADILKTPVGHAGSEDYVAWNYTKNGIFSVKSAYHLRMQIIESQAGRAGPSISCEEHRGWLALWAANVLGKAKIHMWRLIKNGLAVGEELHRRNIKLGIKCIVCNREESRLHRFWGCPHSLRTWELIREQTGMRLSSPDSEIIRPREIQGWILDWLGKMSDEEIAVAIMLIYQMWLARNDAREEIMIADPSDIARQSLFLLQEWQAVQKPSNPIVPRATEHWLPPEVGWNKVNADGSYLASSNIGGCGVVLRDHHGEFSAGVCRFLTSVMDPEQAELMACKQAVVLAKDMGVDRIVLESDCMSALAKISGDGIDRSLHGHLVEEIKVLLAGFAEHRLRHVRRSCNGVAHLLAKEGYCNKVCRTWVGSPPEVIVNLLASECAGYAI
jgi:ribonuclease HI